MKARVDWTRTFRTVHVERQPDDKPGDGVFFGDLQQGGGIEPELDALDGFQRRRDLALDVRQRQSDRLGAEIEPEQPGVIGQAEEVFERHQIG
jgi:hypothetical protein